MVMNWHIVHDTSCNTSSPDPQGCLPVEIFFDGMLQIGDDGVAINGTQPTFTWVPNPASRKYARRDSFRTSIQVDPSKPLHFFPWDEYRTKIFVSAQISGTDTRVGVEVGVSTGLAIGFSVYTMTEHDAALQIPSGVLYENIRITRGAHVKAYSIVIVITVYCLSLVFTFATAMHFVFGYAMGAEFLVIPIATLFTVTSLRSTMPGSPDFGTILDYVALLPCLALLSFCATLTLCTLAFTDHNKQRHHLLHGFFRTRKALSVKVVDTVEEGR